MGRIVTIIGTRPEIIKMAPVVQALDALGHEHVLVHSGQHYDLMMDRIFFRDMRLREPDRQFELKGEPPHLQVATTMRQVAGVTKDADLVIVHGDTNTTVAGALLANKQGRRLAHVEAGIRSFDKTMPEEINEAVAHESGLPILFPIHPRTAKRLREFGLENRADAVATLRRVEPTGYLDMLVLEKNAALVMTDSGGLQEESCFFRVPCVTLRENTERPETLAIRANVLAGTEPSRVAAAVRSQLASPRDWPNPYGDGTTARQIAAVVNAALP